MCCVAQMVVENYWVLRVIPSETPFLVNNTLAMGWNPNVVSQKVVVSTTRVAGLPQSGNDSWLRKL